MEVNIRLAKVLLLNITYTSRTEYFNKSSVMYIAYKIVN